MDTLNGPPPDSAAARHATGAPLARLIPADASACSLPTWLTTDTCCATLTIVLNGVRRPGHFAASHGTRLRPGTARNRAVRPLAGVPRICRALNTTCSFRDGLESQIISVAKRVLYTEFPAITDSPLTVDFSCLPSLAGL